MKGCHVLPFTVAGHRFAIELEQVRRVLPALAITPLPGAPAVIRGVVNGQGQPLPVADLAIRFDWPAQGLSLWQPFLWVHTNRRDLLLPVETVESARYCARDDWRPAAHPNLPTQLLKGVMITPEGLLLIQDLEQVLSPDDEERLDDAIANAQSLAE